MGRLRRIHTTALCEVWDKAEKRYCENRAAYESLAELMPFDPLLLCHQHAVARSPRTNGRSKKEEVRMD